MLKSQIKRIQVGFLFDFDISNSKVEYLKFDGKNERPAIVEKPN